MTSKVNKNTRVDFLTFKSQKPSSSSRRVFREAHASPIVNSTSKATSSDLQWKKASRWTWIMVAQHTMALPAACRARQQLTTQIRSHPFRHRPLKLY